MNVFNDECYRIPAYLPVQAVQRFLMGLPDEKFDFIFNEKELNVTANGSGTSLTGAEQNQSMILETSNGKDDDASGAFDYDVMYYEKLVSKLKDAICEHDDRDGTDCHVRKDNEKLVHVLHAAAQAASNSVNRVHLVNGKEDGALLQELYTRDGVGTLVTAENYDAIRPMNESDVDGVMVCRYI